MKPKSRVGRAYRNNANGPVLTESTRVKIVVGELLARDGTEAGHVRQ